MYLADAADIVVGDVPAPGSYRVPRLDSDLHLEPTKSLNAVETLQLQLGPRLLRWKERKKRRELLQPKWRGADTFDVDCLLSYVGLGRLAAYLACTCRKLSLSANRPHLSMLRSEASSCLGSPSSCLYYELRGLAELQCSSFYSFGFASSP